MVFLQPKDDIINLLVIYDDIVIKYSRDLKSEPVQNIKIINVVRIEWIRMANCLCAQNINVVRIEWIRMANCLCAHENVIMLFISSDVKQRGK